MPDRSYRSILAYALERDDTFKATDFPDKGLVRIHHSDGTTCDFRSAFIEETDGWVIVYTEHTGIHIFAQGDLRGVDEFHDGRIREFSE